ncbi:hypothetical protein [Kordiimonas sp.]|uniref:hypothetical protein n=1 Tax=Kordiimonas sp. TaxID=1970157 RepID=UPI003A8ED6AA
MNKRFIRTALIPALLSLTMGMTLPSVARAESEEAFQASQAARAKATEAFRANDLSAALLAMEEALSLRPSHPLLLGNVAYLAAATGDGERAVEAARAYAALGLVPGAAIRDKIKQAITPNAWHTLEAAFEKNTTPVSFPWIEAALPADLELVEGIALGEDDTLYAATVVSGGIYRVERGKATLLVDAKQHEFGSFFAIMMHEGALYATFARVEQTPGHEGDEGQTGLAKIDPKTGDILFTWVLPGGTADQQIADLTVTDDGTIYLSDAQGKKVWRVVGEGLDLAFSHDGFMSPQGIAKLPGVGLILADYGRGLWLLDEGTGNVTLMDPPENTTLLGIDGLIAHKGKLVAIQNGVNPQRIIEISLKGQTVSGVQILAQELDGWFEPTLGVSTPRGILYVAASQWPKYGKWGAIREGHAEPAPTPIMFLQDKD